MCSYSILPASSGSIPDHALMLASMRVNERPSYTVEQIRSEREVSHLQAEWNRLSEDAEFPNVFMTYDWFRIWNDHLSARDPRGQRSPNILALRKGGAVVGISPLTRRVCSCFGVAARKIEFVTSHADYNDFVLGDDPAGQIEAVMRSLAETSDQWDLVDLRDLRTNGEIIRLIEEALSRTKLYHRILSEKDRCHYLRVNGGSAAVVKKFSGHFRKRLRNQMNRATAEGLRIRIIEGPEQEPRLMEKLISLDHKKHLQRTSPPFIGMHARVFQALFDNLGPRGWLYVALVEKSNQPIAFQLGFRCGKRLWAYSQAYDHDFARLSPGKLLFLAILDYCFSHGFEEFDLLRGEEVFKSIWSDGYHRSSRLLIWNSRWSSRVAKFAHHNLPRAIYQTFGRQL